MKKILLILFALLVTAGVAFAQTTKKESDLSAKVPVDKKVRIGKLDNGLTYYIRANKKPENRVQFRLVTNAGSVLEDDDQQGLAHFCEHMAFNGTKHYKGNEMISELQKNGIEFGRGINAWTAFDETVYYVDLPSDKPEMVEMGFKILDGWAGKLLFTPSEIEHERGVILEEWRMGLGAQDRLRKATWPIMLKGSRYADRLPIGLEDVIRNFKRETIVRFYEDWYRPDMQAVIIVGDIDVDQMEAKVKQYFESYAKRDNPRPRPVYNIPNNKEPLVAIATDKEATNATLMFFWKHPKAPQGTIGDYRASVVRSLINRMLSDRFRELGEKANAPFVMADAGYEGFLGRSCDAFQAYAMPKENKIEDATEMLLLELMRADQHGFLSTELERQKEEMLTNYKRMAKEASKTENVRFAQEYTDNFLEGEVIPGIMQEYKYVQEFLPTITVDEVNKLISQWITDENFVFYLTAPDQQGYRVPDQKTILDIYNRSKQAKTTPWVDNFKDEPFFTKQLPSVQPKVTKVNNALGYTEYTCPNGVRFVVKKTDYKKDQIMLRSFGYGGTSLYSDAECYLAQNAATFIDDAGIAQFNSTQLQKLLKGKTVGLSPNIAETTQGFSGSCSPDDFEFMLQYLYLFFDSPRKDKESFDKNIDQTLNQIKFLGENPQYVFIKKFYETAYPNNPRQIIIPTEQDIKRLNLDRMYSIYRERFNDASAQTYFFVGNISDDHISLIAKYLGNLPANGKQRGEKFVNHPDHYISGNARETVYKGSDNQGMLIVYGQVEGFDTNYHNRLVVSELSDAMTITALEVIREKMGGTYSPSVNIDYEIIPDQKVTWMFYIACDPDKVQVIEESINKLIDQYIKKGPDKKTLAKVQEQMINQRQTGMQENSYWMGQIYSSYYLNENRDFNGDIDQYSALVKKVTAKEVKAMAAKVFNRNNYVVTILKPEHKK